MGMEKINQLAGEFGNKATTALSQPETYTQLGIILAIYAVAFILANRVRRHVPLLRAQPDIEGLHPLRQLAGKIGNIVFPLIAILMLRVSVEISESISSGDWHQQQNGSDDNQMAGHAAPVFARDRDPVQTGCDTRVHFHQHRQYRGICLRYRARRHLRFPALLAWTCEQ